MKDGVELAMIETISNTFNDHSQVSPRGQLQPRFDAKAWLPFKMARESVNWSIDISIYMYHIYFGYLIIVN
jgi:hypothetical protein